MKGKAHPWNVIAGAWLLRGVSEAAKQTGVGPWSGLSARVESGRYSVRNEALPKDPE